MAAANNAINNTVGASVSGVTNTLTVTNPSNTASSQALANITVGGGTSGDPFLTYTVAGVTDWSTGIDNSVSDTFVIAASTALGTTNVMSMTTAGAVSIVLGNLDVTKSASGATVSTTISNTSNTASSNALEQITVAGTSAGDAFTTYTVAGTTNWSVGTDNSVTGDPFVIAASTALGTTNIMSAATTGEINYPLQPSFMAFLSGSINNVTGDGTAYAIICDTEAFDQGGDYDNSTGVFTAPVTGRYSCNCGFRFSGLTTAMTIQDNRVVTSNRSFSTNPAAPSKVFDANTNCSNPYCALMDMDAADTAFMQSTITNGTKVADIGGNATEPRTFFSVYLQA